MSIVAASVVPHSPLLLPSIAKQQADFFSTTRDQITMLADEWYAAKPDVVVIISPHGLPKNGTMAIHSAARYVGTFTEFGNISTTIEADGAVGMMHQLRSAAEHHHVPIHLQTYETLDYGTSVPLSFIAVEQPHLPICSIVVGSHQKDEFVRFAGVLRDFLLSDRRRYLLLASCDMTRRDDRTPDARRRPTSEERIFSSAITAVDPSQLMSLNPQPGTCGYNPLLIALTILHDVSPKGMITSFEAPFGVGLLTASFTLNS